MVMTYSLGKLKIKYLKKSEYFLKDQSKKVYKTEMFKISI